MLWAWPDDVASTASTQSNLLSRTLPFLPLPLPTTTANCINAWQINARQANAAAASRQVPLGTVDAKADVDAGHRYWHRHTMYALALWGSTHTRTHTRTSTPACSCKLKQRRLAFKCKRRAAKKLTNTTQIEKP